MIPELEIYDSSSGSDVFVGTLYSTLRRGGLSTTFSYAASYLSNRQAYAIDPALPLSAAQFHFAGLPGALRDSSPDRWGRHLIERERKLQNDSSESPRTLDDVDFLVGVFDQTREGSLRVKGRKGTFLSASAPVPPIIELPALAAAARKASQDQAGLGQIKELLDAGSGSLGGARPKASVCDGGRLMLAKFSHPGDEWDVMAWEKTALDMAREAGISTPKANLERLGSESALVLERFDRMGSLIDGMRIPYISGMTLLNASDGESRDYIEIAEALADLCDNPEKQLAQLFKRVVFSIAINNTDDHLRNWGLLRQGGKWALSPTFDVNPNPSVEAQRVTSVAGAAGTDVFGTLHEFAIYCGLDDAAVHRVVEEVCAAVSRWQEFARKNGCTQSEQKMFGRMFESRKGELARAV